jgi:hypothetical protein
VVAALGQQLYFSVNGDAMFHCADFVRRFVPAMFQIKRRTGRQFLAIDDASRAAAFATGILPHIAPFSGRPRLQNAIAQEGLRWHVPCTAPVRVRA